MSWNQQMDFHYVGSGASYGHGTAGGFMEFFEGFTYDHVNFIFSGASHMQDSSYPHPSMGYYKFGHSDPETTQYFGEEELYDAYDHAAATNELREPVDLSSNLTNEQTMTLNQQSEGESNTNAQSRNRECPRSHQNSHDYQVIWQDYIDPDDMTYEELLELGEAVGTQNRGLTQEQIASLPVSKFRCCFLLRKRSQSERCVICQMEYKRGDRLLTLPCKHKYHVGCGSKWLSINKACPICYTDVSLVEGAKKEK